MAIPDDQIIHSTDAGVPVFEWLFSSAVHIIIASTKPSSPAFEI